MNLSIFQAIEQLSEALKREGISTLPSIIFKSPEDGERFVSAAAKSMYLTKPEDSLCHGGHAEVFGFPVCWPCNQPNKTYLVEEENSRMRTALEHIALWYGAVPPADKAASVLSSPGFARLNDSSFFSNHTQTLYMRTIARNALVPPAIEFNHEEFDRILLKLIRESYGVKANGRGEYEPLDQDGELRDAAIRAGGHFFCNIRRRMVMIDRRLTALSMNGVIRHCPVQGWIPVQQSKESI